MLFNEPKLLKSQRAARCQTSTLCFSALQRAEIAEIILRTKAIVPKVAEVSVLFNEPKLLKSSASAGTKLRRPSFSALQRAEIAEIAHRPAFDFQRRDVSVLFNEPKLLKWFVARRRAR